MPTPTQPLIVVPEWDLVHGAVFTSNDEVTNYLAQNLGRNGTKNKWKTSNVTGTKTVTVNVGSLKSANFIGLIGHNGRVTDTVQFRLATTQPNIAGSPLANSGSVSLWKTTDMDVMTLKSTFFSFPSQTVQWAQADVTVTGLPAGVFYAGRLVIGNALQTALFPLVGSDFLSGEDYSMIDTGPLGYDNAVVQDPRMDWSKDWFTHDKSEAERITRIWMQVGVTRDLVAAANPVSTTLGDLNYGLFRFRSKPKIRWNARLGEDLGHWSCRLDLKEVR